MYSHQTEPVVVLGGGVIGLSIAWELAEAGWQVTLLERNHVGFGASSGNAGLIVPSYTLPLGGLDAIGEGIRAVFGGSKTLCLGRLTDWKKITWLARFVAAGRMRDRLRVASDINAVAQLSLHRYREIMGVDEGSFCDLTNCGWLDIFETPSSLGKALTEVRKLESLGNRWEHLSPNEVYDRVPGLDVPVSGGILHTDDWVVSPDRVIGAFYDKAIRAGVTVLEHTEVTRVTTKGRRVCELGGNFGVVPVGHWIIAAGWESGTWLHRMGASQSLMPGRGYSITLMSDRAAPKHALNFVERHVVVSVQGTRVRVTGGMDLDPGTPATDAFRLADIRTTGQHLLPQLAWEESVDWAGSRPMTPDGRPLIGPLTGWDNVTIATGHGMLGMTLAAGTAALVRQLFENGGRPPAQMRPFLPG